jgi:ADP-heptose:LPS heptosyltransferase
VEEKMKKILLSRTDKIGDVVLTLPMAGLIKSYYPEAKVYFIGSHLVKPLVEVSVHIDRFIDWDDIKQKSKTEQILVFKDFEADAIVHVFPNKFIARLAKKAGIPVRVGTGHRLFHLFTCNKPVFYSRRRSNLHEAQLNIRLLKLFGIYVQLDTNEIVKYYGLKHLPPVKSEIGKMLESGRVNVIMHPTSMGSAREWGLDNFSRLIELLPEEKYRIFITGTAEDKYVLDGFIRKHKPRIFDLTGELSLFELIGLISQVDALVAASTGPLHIAAALGIKAVGIYPPIEPMHPGRWKPLGINATWLVKDVICNKCRRTTSCECITSIKPEQVVEELEKSRV